MRIREKALSQPVKTRSEIYTDPELGPMVFVQPGFKSSLKINDLETADRIVFMIMNFLYDPVLGEGGEPLIEENGTPLKGKPAFDRADEEVLRDTDWPEDSWFMRIVKKFGEFMKGGDAEEELGKESAGT